MIRKLIPLYLITFLGYFGFSLVLPLFPILLLGDSSFIDPDVSTETRTLLLGALLASYPFGEFFSAPIIGRLSDKFGRKRILIIALALTAPTYALTALSIKYSSLIALFASRCLCGITEAHTVIAKAMITELAKSDEQKRKIFGGMVSASSLGYIFGPVCGSYLASSSSVSWFTFETPFWITSLVILFIIALTYFWVEETQASEIPAFSLSSIKNYPTRLKRVFLANHFLYTSHYFIFGFISVFLMRRFDIGLTSLGKINAYFSIPICLAPLLTSKLTAKFESHHSAIFSSLLLAFAIPIIIFTPSPMWLLATLLPAGIFISIGYTYANVMVTDEAEKKHLGEAIGINESVSVLSEAFTGLAGGALAILASSLPLYIAACFALVSALFLRATFAKPVREEA